MKKGTDVAVAVPFGSLPGDFRIEPMKSKSVPPKDVADEAAADMGSKATGGEVATTIVILGVRGI